MAMLALVASVALMAVTADTANAAVTEITTVCNYTNQEIYIWNHESGKRIVIAPAEGQPPLRTCKGFNEWVPWAWNADRFDEGHFIEVGYVETLIFLRWDTLLSQVLLLAGTPQGWRSYPLDWPESPRGSPEVPGLRGPNAR